MKVKIGVFRLRKNFVASGWDDLAYEDWYVQMLDFLQLTYAKLAPNGAVIIFMSIMKVESIIEIAQKAGFYYKTTGIWHKTNPMPKI
jgi:site-specific DNA-methyltransferase (adenine-specific)